MKVIGQSCIPDLSNEEYHANKDYISRSSLMDFSQSPYNYWAKHINPDRPKRDSTPQMILGSAFHTLMLEPDKFNNEYAILPQKVLLKDVGRETYDAFKKLEKEMLEGSQAIITSEEYINLMNMKLTVEANQSAMQLINGARIENSFFWKDEHSGLNLKCRPDVLQPNIIVDLKTCSDASERVIQNELFRYGYDIQMAMIRDAVEHIEGNRIENFILICVETKYPYNLGIYMLDEEIIDNAQCKYKNLALQMKEAIQKNEWKDYGIRRILLPKWAVYG